MLPCEEATIRAFIVAERQPRWLTMLANDKQRSRFLDRLNHCRDFDKRSVVPLGTGQGALAELRKRGAPDQCHLISENRKLDGQQMRLVDALDTMEGLGFGTLMCCTPGRLGYFYDEAGARRWLLVKTELRS